MLGFPDVKRRSGDAVPAGKVIRFATCRCFPQYPENVTWATRMILPTEQRFFPDFDFGIKGRSTRDSVALAEIKDDGVDGRLHSDKNVLKIQVQHREYRNVFWTYSGEQGFGRLTYNKSLNRIGPIEPFMVSKMVLLSA